LPDESRQNSGRYLPAEYANGDRLNPVEFMPMILKIRQFKAGFERFFVSVNNWILLLTMPNPEQQLKQATRFTPYAIDYNARFWGGF